MSNSTHLSLFGGDLPWSPLDWISSDDTVRGGNSYSNLNCSPADAVAVFQGNLDIKTLGGAGFASQRTTAENEAWNLAGYEGISLDVKKSDGKKYTLILKDQVPERDQSTVGWEFGFIPDTKGEIVKVFWSEFKPTFRGRECKDTAPLDLEHIRNFSLMMRSFFGTQEGEFSLSLASISAFKGSVSEDSESYFDDIRKEDIFDDKLIKRSQSSPYKWLKSLFCFATA
ncbi:hypothetical protein K3495_g765 [Podosphaera aphanis]|nr:hypothetical protein K3495_g765 [Podosphaera aphanis]